MAPYEFSFPYHAWVKDEQAKELRSRLHLPVAETLHLVHVLKETVMQFVLGARGGRDAACRHLLQARDAEGHVTKIFAVLRLEFQDGTRKEPTQSYHGSGRPHVHVLLWWDDEVTSRLELDKHVSATLPDEGSMLRGYVIDSQQDKHGRSGWPVHEGASGWDHTAGCVRLRHTAEDAAMGLRAYFPAVMDVLRCHQDVLLAQDQAGLLRAYVAKYVSKFSDAAADEWLNDDADGNSIAATVLHRYHPFEPEVILQMFGAKFRQWDMTTVSRGKRSFIVPEPDRHELPMEIEQYCSAHWAAGQIPLLEFLRKTNRRGAIAHWLRREHERVGGERDLHDFAREFEVRGQQVVAVTMVSRFNDRHYGQWLMLNVPFADPRQFVNEDLLRRVPKEYRYLTMVLTCEHPVARATWSSRDRLEAEMVAEARDQRHIQMIVGMVAAHRVLIDLYLAGRLDAAAEARERQRRQEAMAAPGALPPASDFNERQRRYMDRVNEMVDTALAAQGAESERDADAARDKARAENRVCICLGPPGTGKTTATHAYVERALELGGRVLFALPTAQLASRMRERYGDRVEIDTCAAAFAFMEPENDLPLLGCYALIVVDELSQLQQWQFDRIVKLWCAADRVPVLAMMGDKWQIAGFGELRAWDSALWRSMTFRVTLHEDYRCRDAEHQALLKVIRTAKPGARLLRKLRQKRAWRPGPPTVRGVRALLKQHRQTTILTCTRRGAARVNGCALRGLFPNYPALVTLAADVESNPDNYRDGILKPVGELVAGQLPIFRRMRVYLTRNVRKDIDFVNGMSATVTGFDKRSRGLHVVTATGYQVVVYPWADRDLGNIVYYPVRAGYASTILKFQGAELQHVTVYLDSKGIPGAAYTALSRVGYFDRFLLGGYLNADHFTPAR